MSKSTVPLAPDDSRHGSTNAYSNHVCRCPDCREAWRIYQVQRRAERGRALVRNPRIAPHGRASTYGNWGCRCQPCKDAWADAGRATAANRRKRIEIVSVPDVLVPELVAA